MHTYPPDSHVYSYFMDAWLYAMPDFESPDCAFFRVTPVDVDAFPELVGVYGLKLDAGQATSYHTIDQFAAAVAGEC